MEEPINITSRRVTKVREGLLDQTIPTTPVFEELLKALEENDQDRINEKLLDLFQDFSKLRYLKSQFVAVNDLVRPYLDDAQIQKLLKILENYIRLEAEAYASGFERLDANGGTQVRALNIKQDLVEVYDLLVELLADPGLKGSCSELRTEVLGVYESTREKFFKFLRERDET